MLVYIVILSNLLVIKLTEARELFHITDWEGTLSTPDYPMTYPTNSNLTWIKSVSPGNKVKITVQDLETQCNGDYLEIRDGDSVVSPLIRRFCGKLDRSQSEIISSGTSILLRFVSDNVNDTFMDRGFILQHIGICKVHINQTSGVITTPNHPDNYPNYMDCLWTIQLHPAMLIPLVCDEIAIEKEEGCPYDYMEILEGDGLHSTVIERHCGVLHRSLTIERNGSLSIRFVSDQDKENKGFRCSYNILRVRGYWTQWTEWTGCSHHENQTRSRTCINPLPESGLDLLCGDIAETERRKCTGELFHITDWEGTLSTPDYPQTYPTNSDLTWIKIVSPGNKVKITIQDFETQCSGDYLEIRDGDSMESPLIERLCGKLDKSPSEITSSGTSILLRFVSDNVDTFVDRGFFLLHSGICKVHINQTTGVIATPNYPYNYPNYMDCLWTIQLHPAMLIPLVCDEIAIEKEEGCPYDYMEILEGDGLHSTVIERHCGVLHRSLTIERNGSLSIRFVSDQDKENKGFLCSYNILRVRGYWTQWTEWTGCSRHENQTRSRTCVNPLPESGLELLCGDIAETERQNCSVISLSNT